MTTHTIYETKDYDKFSDLFINRVVRPTQVEKKVNLILKNDMTSLMPIIVTPDLKIIDGQHRFRALKQLNKPIFYVIKNDYQINDVMDINASSTDLWKGQDFLEYYIKQGKVNYIIFSQIMKKFEFNLTELLHLIGAGDKLRNPHQDFKDGTLVLRNEKDITILTSYLHQMKPFYRTTPTPLVKAIVFLYDWKPEVKFKKLFEQLQVEKRRLRGDKLEASTKTEFVLLQLETIYNHKARKVLRFADRTLLNSVSKGRVNKK